uniref:porin n=1 Tax=uncultured Psychrosphaera sp. TaxID=1403522 RepID=UPI0030F635F2
MKKTLAAAIIVALGAASTSALAETRINGFASIVAGVMTDKDTSLFGYSDNLSFKPESLFALQVSSDLGEGLSATAQIMSRGENDYSTEFEWAYLSYEISDSTQINAGKLRIPFYRYSDFLDVGYAYNWARPPQTVYNLVFSTFDGVSIVNNHTLGDWDSSIQAIYGSYDGSVNLLSNEDPAELNNMMGVNWTVSYDWLTARAVYMVAETSISFDNNPDPDQILNKGISLVGAVFPEAADSLVVSEDNGSFFGLGLSVDYNNFLVDAEFTTVEVEDSIVATQEQYYVSVGYRFDTYTVYAITEHREDKNDDNYS